MSRQLAHSLAQEIPEYFEMQNILRMAAQTWPRFGISAGELSQLDSWTVELLRVSLAE
jgi:hypothetical protein